MKHNYFCAIAYVGLSLVASASSAGDILTGAGVEQSKCQILIGDPIAGMTRSATFGHIQGILELSTESAVEGITFETNVSTYPNPTDMYLFIRREKAEEANYVLTSLAGRIYMTGLLKEPLETLDLATLPYGIYILSISQPNNQPITTKIIKR